MLRSALALALALIPQLAVADARIVGREAGSRAWHPGPFHARVGESLELRLDAPAPAGATVRWFAIAPHMQHVDLPPPNEGIAQYSNSVLFGPNHGRWIGYDTIEYDLVPIGTGERLRIDRHPGPNGHEGAGTAFVVARIESGDTIVSSPSLDARDAIGLAGRVTRVSFRLDDSYLGWLSTYFAVPNIFGSTAGQVDRYLGADCADVLVGALRAAGKRSMRYTSVGAIGRYARAASEVMTLGEDGVLRGEEGAPIALEFGRDVLAGDFLAIDYSGAGDELPRAWDHIAAVATDAGASGRFDPDDLIWHMTPGGLEITPVDHARPLRLRVWRRLPAYRLPSESGAR
jgi:hypothetical protein